MTKKNNKIVYILILLSFLTLGNLKRTHNNFYWTPAHVSANEVSNNFQLQAIPEKLDYNSHTVVSIEVPDSITPAEILIDGTPIGGAAEISVDVELKEHTLSIAEETTAGKKELNVTVIDEAGAEWNGTIELEILPRNIEESTDFDWDEAIIYFLLTDRFNDGDSSNNNPNGENYDTAHPESYHGGDFQGIIDQLDYLDELGINTIWITPIVDNVNHNHRHGKEGSQYGYHGYWAKDFTKIDEHLGDLNTFKNLIDEAHERGIKLMVDVVINHTGYGMKISDQGANIPNFPTVAEQEVFQGMLRENPYSGHEVLGELYGLPDFMTEDPEVRNQIIQWQTDWIEKSRTDKGNTIDYFRVDTVKHVDDTTLNAFKNELTKVKPDFKLIGEHFGGTYNQTGGFLNSGKVDSLLDFDFKRLASMFVHGNIENAEAELTKRNEAINNQATVGQFLSSHDEDGFLYYFAQGDEDLFKVAVSLQLTAKGQPVIYYGEEIGHSGPAEGDMDQLEFSGNREDFDWEKAEDYPLVEHYKNLLNIRKDYSKIFAKGTREQLAGSDDEGFSIFERNYEGESIYVALNPTTDPITTTFAVDLDEGTFLKDLYQDVFYEVEANQEVSIEIPGNADGGTVILAVTDEEPSSVSGQSNLAIILMGAGVALLGVAIYFSRRAKQ